MKSISVFVPGDPKGQPRPRAFARGGKARVYDPGTAEFWKGEIAIALKDYRDLKIRGPVSVTATFRLRRPKSHYRANGDLKANRPMYHTQTFDVDNLLKALFDALTTIGIWVDDAQVAQVVAMKVWADDRAGVDLGVEELWWR